MLRRFLPVLLAVGLATTAVPSHAATKTSKLFFGNTGTSNETGCLPVYSLVPTPTGSECSGTFLAANGAGVIADDTYSTGKKTALKVDTARPLTGTIYVSHFALINTGDSKIPGLPGYHDLDILIKMNGVTVGTVHVAGPSAPTLPLKADFSLAIPKSLTKKVVTKVTAAVTWNTTVGLSGITYHDPVASFMTVPVK